MEFNEKQRSDKADEVYFIYINCKLLLSFIHDRTIVTEDTIERNRRTIGLNILNTRIVVHVIALPVDRLILAGLVEPGI